METWWNDYAHVSIIIIIVSLLYHLMKVFSLPSIQEQREEESVYLIRFVVVRKSQHTASRLQTVHLKQKQMFNQSYLDPQNVIEKREEMMIKSKYDHFNHQLSNLYPK